MWIGYASSIFIQEPADLIESVKVHNWIKHIMFETDVWHKLIKSIF